MTSSTENNDELVKDLAKSLQITSSLMQNLLSEIRQNSTSLAVLKEKLEAMRDNVDTISDVIRSGDGKESMTTRLALVEQTLDNLGEQIDEYHKELHEELKAEKESDRNQSMGKLKVAAVAIPGLVSLIILVIKLIIGEGGQ